jgi:hypothetical protein
MVPSTSSTPSGGRIGRSSKVGVVPPTRYSVAGLRDRRFESLSVTASARCSGEPSHQLLPDRLRLAILPSCGTSAPPPKSSPSRPAPKSLLGVSESLSGNDHNLWHRRVARCPTARWHPAQCCSRCSLSGPQHPLPPTPAFGPMLERRVTRGGTLLLGPARGGHVLLAEAFSLDPRQGLATARPRDGLTSLTSHSPVHARQSGIDGNRVTGPVGREGPSLRAGA